MPDQQQTLNRALSFGGASAISTGLAFAAINFLGIAQMLGYVRGPLAWAEGAAYGCPACNRRFSSSRLPSLARSAITNRSP
jgi:hypothetical protein